MAQYNSLKFAENEYYINFAAVQNYQLVFMQPLFHPTGNKPYIHSKLGKKTSQCIYGKVVYNLLRKFFCYHILLKK